MTIETAVRASKELEGLLELGMGASGKGLHEKLSSVEENIPGPLARKLRRIATIRNKAVHELDYEIENPLAFSALCAEAITELHAHTVYLAQRRASEAAIRGADAVEEPVHEWAGMPLKQQLVILVVLSISTIMIGFAIYFRSAPLSGSAANPMQSRAGYHAVDTDPSLKNLAKEKTPQEILMKRAKSGNGVSLQDNPIVELHDAAVFKGNDAFGKTAWELQGELTNKTSKYLSSVEAAADIYLPGHPEYIATVFVNIDFGEHGLAPGKSYTFNQALNDYHENEPLQVPDWVNPKTLGVILRIDTISDGTGNYYLLDKSGLTPIDAVANPRASETWHKRENSDSFKTKSQSNANPT